MCIPRLIEVITASYCTSYILSRSKCIDIVVVRKLCIFNYKLGKVSVQKLSLEQRTETVRYISVKRSIESDHCSIFNRYLGTYSLLLCTL